MSTRSCIATPKGDGFTNGIYIHFDGYPVGVGANILDTVQHSSVDDLLEYLKTKGANGFRSSGPALSEWEAFDDGGPMSTIEWQGLADTEFLWIEWSYVIADAGLMVFASCNTGETVTRNNGSYDYESPLYQPRFAGLIPWDVEDVVAACDAVEAKGRELSDQAYSEAKKSAVPV